MDQFSRTRLLLGDTALEALHRARVAIFGIGGVGGYACEALARCGVGAFDIIDNDVVSLTNVNRQIIATHATLGRSKTEVMRDRMLDIYPDAVIRIHNRFVLPENIEEFPWSEYSYVVDAIDTVSAKLSLIEAARQNSVPVISAMGAGNKLQPERFRVSDITETRTCPLARVMRRELRKRGIEHVKVVWSDEPPVRADASAPQDEAIPDGKRSIPGSIAFAPAVAGLLLASQVVRDLTSRMAE